MRNVKDDEHWLREKAAIEDRSLLSVGGLVSKIKETKPRKKQKS
jgi:hypothetical protein